MFVAAPQSRHAIRWRPYPYAKERALAPTEIRGLEQLIFDWLLGARGSFSTHSLEVAIAQRNDALADRAALERAWHEVAAEVARKLGEAMRERGTAEIDRLGFGFTFTLDNPYAREYAAEQTARLVTQVTESTRQAIRDLVGREFSEHMTTAEAARAMRPLIGLTSRDAGAVMNRQLAELADDIEPPIAQRRAEAYADRLLRNRATLIARTETIDSEGAGVQASWLTARDRGLLLPQTKRVWIAGSKNTCGVCEFLNGQMVGLDEPFVDDAGEEYARPGAHPACECTMGLVTDTGGSASDEEE